MAAAGMRREWPSDFSDSFPTHNPLPACPPADQFFVYAGNIAGMVMGLWYVLSSYGLATAEVRKKIELVTIGLVASLVATITFGGIVYGGNEVATMGIFANVIVFVVFSSPLSTLAMVVREKNSASINRPFGIVQVLNCITWTFYSLFISDWYLFVPNLVGLVLGLIQCALMLIFPAKKSIKIDELSEPVPRSAESLLQESSGSLP